MARAPHVVRPVTRPSECVEKMQAVDSKAVFNRRLAELGLSEREERFAVLGWDSHGNFAFAVPSGPGGVVDDLTFATQVIRPLYDLNASAELPPQKAAVRRLFFESHALSVGELRMRVERTDSDAPRKVPQAEREARKNVIRQKLQPGLIMEGDLEPANLVIDRFSQMVDDNTVEWVMWDEVPKRDQEIAVHQTKKKWLADSAGVVKEKTVRPEAHADVSSGLKISWALQRRGIAAEIAGLMTFQAHEKVRMKLMTALTREPPDPRCSPPSLEAVKAADKEIWRLLAKACCHGVRPASAVDALPVDLKVDEVLASMEVNLILIPVMSAGAAQKRRHGGRDNESDDGENHTPVREHKRQKRQQQTPPPPSPHPQGGSSKGGSKGVTRQMGPPMPRELLGQKSQTKDGRRICYGYNLGTCKNDAKNGGCDRGAHVCTKCEGKHPASGCSM